MKLMIAICLRLGEHHWTFGIRGSKHKQKFADLALARVLSDWLQWIELVEQGKETVECVACFTLMTAALQ